MYQYFDINHTLSEGGGLYVGQLQPMHVTVCFFSLLFYSFVYVFRCSFWMEDQPRYGSHVRT